MAVSPGVVPQSQEKLQEELDAMEQSIGELQVLYEKYFLGIDRRPPDKERKRISDRMRVLKGTQVKNTALKFRLHTMFAKLISFERMWDRTLREMEEGTYRRDVFKAKLHGKKKEAGKGKEVAAAGSPAVHLSDEKLRKLYDTYLVARQRTGEPVAGLTFDSVATRIRAQVPELLARHKAKNIEFKVVIKGGKAVLKAVPLT
ncbi:MAG: MXAN_5187 C-terminal domain-containing protein [Myxococcales bacterium]